MYPSHLQQSGKFPTNFLILRLPSSGPSPFPLPVAQINLSARCKSKDNGRDKQLTPQAFPHRHRPKVTNQRQYFGSSIPVREVNVSGQWRSGIQEIPSPESTKKQPACCTGFLHCISRCLQNEKLIWLPRSVCLATCPVERTTGIVTLEKISRTSK